MQQRFAVHTVTVAVSGGQVTQSCLRADIAPANVARHNGNPAGFFHDGIINRVFGYVSKRLRVKLGMREALALRAARLFKTRADSLKNAGTMLAHLVKHRARLEAKHA